MAVLAVEDDLQVASHRVHLVSPPALLLQLVQLVGLEVIAVDAHQTDQGQQHRLVSIAQRGTMQTGGNDAVSLADNLTQQIALQIRLLGTVQHAEARLEIAPRILHLPEKVIVFCREELQQETGFFATVGILLGDGCLHQVIGKPRHIDMLACIGGVGEEGVHLGILMPLAHHQFVDGLLTRTAGGYVSHLVLVVHIPHIAIGVVHRDLQVRTLLHQLQHGTAHREHAAGDDGAARIDKGSVAEDLREVLKHAMGYLAHLHLAFLCQVAPTTFCVGNILAYLFQGHLTCCGQLTQRVGLMQRIIGYHKALHVVQIARAMTTVMTDIKRYIALRGWCQLGQIVI